MSSSTTILTLELRHEQDVVLARQRARQVAALLGFDPREQTLLATAASEVARDVLQLGGAAGGHAEFGVAAGPPPALLIRIGGPGVPAGELQAIAQGKLPAPNGLGLGLLGARRLVDRLAVEPDGAAGGATVALSRALPRRAAVPAPDDLARIVEELGREAPRGPLEEVRQQNRELLRIMDELRDRQAAVTELNRELEETNRGVLALYAELDDKANALRRASDLKTRFLSDMSHEFRSPLNTILSLAGFLLDRADGPLTAEQEKQVHFIRKAAGGLAELVNDLLDLAKVEAGKTVVRPAPFEVADLFAALRGMIRPLMAGDAVALAFDDPAGLPPLLTDEGKLAQILRNFLTNALKFTERGEVRVAAAAGPGGTIRFAVTDTGIGIAPGDLGRIFEEFGQVEGPIQARVKGTGLGLPLSRRLAELLGGGVAVRSTPGVGSTFEVAIPRRFPGTGDPGAADDAADADAAAAADGPPAPDRLPVLVVEDDPATLYLYEKYLEGSGFRVVPAASIAEARAILKGVRPAAVLLDVLLEAESGWTLLEELKRRASTRAVPVFVLTVVDGQERALALGADEFCIKPVERDWLLGKLEALRRRGPVETVLVVDDEESYRYVLRGLLEGLGCRALTAADGREGLRRARADAPDAIFLDLVMPDLTGFEVLEQLKADPATAAIPVIIHSSKVLDAAERGRLEAAAVAILAKDLASREAALGRLRAALVKAGLRPAGLVEEADRG